MSLPRPSLRRALAPFAAAALLLGALPASAGGAVFLNDVPVDGLTDQRFEKATVTFDAQGNVRIEVPGIQVKSLGLIPAKPAAPARPAAAPTLGPQSGTVVPNRGSVAVVEPAPAAPTGSLQKQYLLVTEQSVSGMAGYDIDVFVNTRWVKKLRSTDEQIVLDLTRYLQPGPNKLLFAARKLAGERKSFSPSHRFDVTVGEGSVGGDHVMIDNPLLTFRRTAADTDDVSEEFSLQAH